MFFLKFTASFRVRYYQTSARAVSTVSVKDGSFFTDGGPVAKLVDRG